LKKQFSLASNTPSANDTDITRPPRKRQATKLDYDSDTPEECPQSTTVSITNSVTTTQQTRLQTQPPTDYAAELLAIKKELSELRNFITSAVAELKKAIVSLPTQCHPSPSETETPNLSNMETEVEPPTANTPALSDLIADLRHDIATKTDISDLIVELRSDIAIIKSHPIFRHLTSTNQSPVT